MKTCQFCRISVFWKMCLANLPCETSNHKWNPWLLNLIVFTPNGIAWEPIKHIPWVVPPPSNSHHQDYYIFSRDPYKPSFATITGRGDNPTYPPTFLYSWNMTAEIWYSIWHWILIWYNDQMNDWRIHLLGLGWFASTWVHMIIWCMQTLTCSVSCVSTYGYNLQYVIEL